MITSTATNGNLAFEDAKIIYRNFAGTETKFNRAGDRNFCIVINDPDVAAALTREGYNVKERKKRDEDDDPSYYLKVNVSYGFTPPAVHLITSKKQVSLDEDTIGTLDNADIKTCDIIIRPYHWTAPGDRSGTSAYLKSLYVVIEEDEFASKYNSLPTDEDAPF